jgi:hypothetical protein
VPLAHEATRTPPSAAGGRSNVVVFAKRATKGCASNCAIEHGRPRPHATDSRAQRYGQPRPRRYRQPRPSGTGTRAPRHGQPPGTRPPGSDGGLSSRPRGGGVDQRRRWSVEPNGGMGAGRRRHDQQEAEQDSPQGRPVRPAHCPLAGATGRAPTVDLDHPRAAPIGDLAPDRHCTPGRRLRTRSRSRPLRRAPRSLWLWHLAVLFLGLTGLADGLAPKERRYG